MFEFDPGSIDDEKYEAVSGQFRHSPYFSNGSDREARGLLSPPVVRRSPDPPQPAEGNEIRIRLYGGKHDPYDSARWTPRLQGSTAKPPYATGANATNVSDNTDKSRIKIADMQDRAQEHRYYCNVAFSLLLYLTMEVVLTLLLLLLLRERIIFRDMSTSTSAIVIGTTGGVAIVLEIVFRWGTNPTSWSKASIVGYHTVILLLWGVCNSVIIFEYSVVFVGDAMILAICIYVLVLVAYAMSSSCSFGGFVSLHLLVPIIVLGAYVLSNDAPVDLIWAHLVRDSTTMPIEYYYPWQILAGAITVGVTLFANVHHVHDALLRRSPEHYLVIASNAHMSRCCCN